MNGKNIMFECVGIFMFTSKAMPSCSQDTGEFCPILHADIAIAVRVWPMPPLEGAMAPSSRWTATGEGEAGRGPRGASLDSDLVPVLGHVRPVRTWDAGLAILRVSVPIHHQTSPPLLPVCDQLGAWVICECSPGGKGRERILFALFLWWFLFSLIGFGCVGSLWRVMFCCFPWVGMFLLRVFSF